MIRKSYDESSDLRMHENYVAEKYGIPFDEVKKILAIKLQPKREEEYARI